MPSVEGVSLVIEALADGFTTHIRMLKLSNHQLRHSGLILTVFAIDLKLTAEAYSGVLSSSSLSKPLYHSTNPPYTDLQADPDPSLANTVYSPSYSSLTPYN